MIVQKNQLINILEKYNRNFLILNALKSVEMERHINIVAAIQLGFSILGIIIGIFVYILLFVIGGFVDESQAQTVIFIIAKIAFGFIIFLSLPGIIAGIGLLKRKEWARVLSLILGVIDLINFPLGTAIGIYTIWAMVQPEVIQQFRNQV